MFNFDSEEKKPEERIAGRAAEYLPRAKFDRVKVAIEVLGCPGTQGYLGERHFH